MGSPSPDPGAPGAARRGTVLAGRYRLDHPLATGGMARVWRATDEVLTRPVAVKVLLEHLAEDDGFVTRFRAEALAAARLTHPSVVSVYDTCSEDGVEAIVMELVDGTTLRHRLDEAGALDPREAARIGARVADALAAAHRAGIIHRDIKPANVLLAPGGRVVVTDFGIAKASENGDLTGGGQMLGTAKYLAPEQVEGAPVDGRADVYALGVVLFEAVCGRVPFLADTEAATALARLHHDPPAPRSLRPDLPPEVEATILRTLARDRDDRWPDAASLSRALGALAAGRPLPADLAARATGAATPSPPPPRAAGATPAATAPRPAPAPSRPPHQAAPRPAEPSPPPDDPQPSAPARRPRGPALLVAAVVLGSLAVIGLLGWRLLAPSAEVVTVASVQAFDPHGGDGERDELAPLAVDGDTTTAWRSETYDDPDITVLKPGVGLVVDLGERHEVDGVEVTSPSEGWSGSLHVLDDAPGPTFPDGVEVAGAVEGSDGDARLSADGRAGRYVVVWFTRTGDDGVVQVDELAVSVRS